MSDFVKAALVSLRICLCFLVFRFPFLFVDGNTNRHLISQLVFVFEEAVCSELLTDSQGWQSTEQVVCYRVQ